MDARRILPVRLDEMPVRPGDRRKMACPDGTTLELEVEEVAGDDPAVDGLWWVAPWVAP